jgi:rod shape determining protein RodA
MFEATLIKRYPRLDWWLLAALGGLMLIGVAFIYSATTANENSQFLSWYDQNFFKQILWYGMGLSVVAVICFIDYHILSRWSVVAYWAMILLLIAVLIPGIGKKISGARRWIDLGFFNLQPSEFAKLAFIFAQAHFLSRPADELRVPAIFLKSLGLLALPFVLIMAEPDLGSALVLLPIGLVMLYAAGTPKGLLLKLLGASGALVALVLVDVLFIPKNYQIIPLEDYQRHRLLVFFGQDFAPPNATEAEKQRSKALQRDKSYNVEQALISVGSGGLTGKGWCQGTQNRLGFLPRSVAHNDFIFSVIAEEEGFVGSVIVVTLYSVILFSGIRIAGEARDRLGKLLAVGVVAMLFSHIFINIGMNIRIMPVTGVPLPLLSYGGSSVLCSLIAIGILQNVYLYRRSY